MRVAVVSEDGLPDIRVEKMMNTLSRIAEEVHFIGRFRGFSGLPLGRRPIVHGVVWNKYAALSTPPYYLWVERAVLGWLRRIGPDVVVSVNLVPTYISLKSGIPTIMDYHEVYSEMLDEMRAPNPILDLGLSIIKKIYYKLENILREIPYVTVSEEAADYFVEKYGNENYIVVKNYPSVLEVRDLVLEDLEDCDFKRFLYIGKDLLRYEGKRFRDLRETLRVLEEAWRERGDFEVLLAGDRNGHGFVRSLGWLGHMELYRLINEAHFGLLSYSPNRVQRYFSHNKAYMYAHLGTVPIVTETLSGIVRDLNGNALIVRSGDFTDSLREVIGMALDMDCGSLNDVRRRLHAHARENLLW